ncbi:MAG: hypothetical protein M3M94_05525 [Actinomycetota bacterium]|nr:hypothetical protein [Actinomycetota bacterium]
MCERPDDPIPPLLDEIRALLVAPATGETAPVLTELEDTLTEGYARALELEATRWRLERKISEVAAGLASAAEISVLARRVSCTGADLARLRELLAALQARARACRAEYATGA